MSFFVQNKNLNVTVKNTDYSKDSSLQSILTAIGVSNTALGAINDTNTKLDTLNGSIATVLDASKNALKVEMVSNIPTVAASNSAQILTDSTYLQVNATSDAFVPVGKTITVWGNCVDVNGGDGSTMTLTVQYSRDGITYVNSKNTLDVLAGESFDLTFESSAPFVRVISNQVGFANVFTASR